MVGKSESALSSLGRDEGDLTYLFVLILGSLCALLRLTFSADPKMFW